MKSNLEAMPGLLEGSTTIVGANWRKDYLTAGSGNIDQHAYTLAAHRQQSKLVADLTATVKPAPPRETFGNQRLESPS